MLKLTRNLKDLQGDSIGNKILVRSTIMVKGYCTVIQQLSSNIDCVANKCLKFYRLYVFQSNNIPTPLNN
jgi:hypothetical protein